jgi:glucose uptake protein GlcU
MDATTMVLASVTGMAFMGDQVAQGRGWWVGIGLALVVLGVLVLGSAHRAVPVKELV